MHSPPDPPLPGDSVTVGLQGQGERWRAGDDHTAGASSSPQGAMAMYGFVARAMFGTATCTAVNNRGESVKKTISIGR